MISRDKLEQRIAALEMAEKHRRDATSGTAAVEEFIAPCYLPLHEDIKAEKHRFYNLPGGRGSCKSSFVSLEVVSGIMQDCSGESNGIVFRAVGNTLRDSVYTQIGWAIDTLGVSHLWRGRVSPISYTYLPTGAQILFRGLDSSEKLKSIKPRRGVFRYVWIEEFSELPGANFARSVLQSVVRGRGAAPQVFRSFNPPISKTNWANQFVAEPDEQGITFHTTYRDVPAEWLGESFIAEAERLAAVNERAYRHEYLGEATGTGAEVFPLLEVREITAEEVQNMQYFFSGVDFGFAADPACFIRCSYDRKHEVIYILNEIYKRGMSNRQLAEEIAPLVQGDTKGESFTSMLSGAFQDRSEIYCDCAEPKSIRDLRDCGLNRVRACTKFPGCVEYRIKWLQNRRIVIDPVRTPNAAREFANYEYAKDKDGNMLSTVPDADNHSIDALAYALNVEIYIKRGQTA